MIFKKVRTKGDMRNKRKGKENKHCKKETGSMVRKKDAKNYGMKENEEGIK